MSYEFEDGYKIRDQGALHFMTFQVMGWIDIFSRQTYRDIVLNNIEYCRQNKNLLHGAYVIMTNHIHVIWRSKSEKMSDLLRDFKSFTSKQIVQAVQNEPESRRDWLLHMFRFYANRTNQNKEFKVWTNNNHPEEIYTEKFLLTKLSYLHQNPVRAGLVELPEHYIYSSASNYKTGKGITAVDLLI